MGVAMSIDGFVARQQARLAELEQLITAQIKRDKGVQVKKNLKSLVEERDKLKTAIDLATRKGLRTNVVQMDSF